MEKENPKKYIFHKTVHQKLKSKLISKYEEKQLKQPEPSRPQ